VEKAELYCQEILPDGSVQGLDLRLAGAALGEPLRMQKLGTAGWWALASGSLRGGARLRSSARQSIYGNQHLTELPRKFWTDCTGEGQSA
jgi:hypothetical protein